MEYLQIDNTNGVDKTVFENDNTNEWDKIRMFCKIEHLQIRRLESIRHISKQTIMLMDFIKPERILQTVFSYLYRNACAGTSETNVLEISICMCNDSSL